MCDTGIKDSNTNVKTENSKNNSNNNNKTFNLQLTGEELTVLVALLGKGISGNLHVPYHLTEEGYKEMIEKVKAAF